MPNPSAMTRTPDQPEGEPPWFVQTAGRVWGPYSPVRVARFVAEGRLTPQSLVSADIEGPFHPAARWRSLAQLFASPTSYRHQPAPVFESQPAARPTPPPQPTPAAQPVAAPSLDPAPVASSAAPLRPFLVWADLASLSAEQFEALLTRYGAMVAIRPGLWLLQGPLAAAALRNALSRRLTGADALMIVHAPLDQAAWFNLDSAERRFGTLEDVVCIGDCA
jgi:hypothetical protein